MKLIQIKEKERSRVLKAAERREEWINMVATDPDFIQGKYSHSLTWLLRFLTRSLTLVPSGSFQVQRLQSTRARRAKRFSYQNFNGQLGIRKDPTLHP